jgi:phenylalanyl-tRNA synthetase alpha chain
MIDTMEQAWSEAIQACMTHAELEAARLQILGKRGAITQALKELKHVDSDERPARGAALNRVRDAVQAAWALRRDWINDQAIQRRLQAEVIDFTLPGRPSSLGSCHPITVVSQQIIQYFQQIGFDLESGPDLETEFHNFDALNMSAQHPARQMHDTFYVDHPGYLLRTHTSGVQIRACARRSPPLRMLSVGRVYRSDASDSTHTPMFHQIEGLVIDRDIHMGHLKGTLYQLFRAFFQHDNPIIRFRPSFFPFTEPSAELDIAYTLDGNALKIGQGSQWVELLGCGMVHPHVLRACGVTDPEMRGFAFGMGVERLAALKMGIPDIRAFFEGDIRWLQHYGQLL